MKFDTFIRTVLKGQPDYRSNVRLAGDADVYLSKYDEDEFPNLVVDEDLLSFSNGVLILSKNEFMANEEAEQLLRGRVARHHVDLQYTGEVDGEDAFISALYSEAFPNVEDREYFVKVMAEALLGERESRELVVLTEEEKRCQAGAGCAELIGARTLVKALKDVFGATGAERLAVYDPDQDGGLRPGVKVLRSKVLVVMIGGGSKVPRTDRKVMVLRMGRVWVGEGVRMRLITQARRAHVMLLARAMMRA